MDQLAQSSLVELVGVVNGFSFLIPRGEGEAVSTKSTEEEGNEWARIVWHRFDAVKRMPGSKQMGRCHAES